MRYLQKYFQKDLLLAAFLVGMIYLLLSGLHDIFEHQPRREVDLIRVAVSALGLAFWVFIVVLEIRRRRKGG